MLRSTTALPRPVVHLGGWRRGILQDTKIKGYKAVILSTLLYGCETWTVYRRHEKQLQHVHLRSLRMILNISWQDKIPDSEVLERAALPSAITIMQKAQTRWAGHVSRMANSRIPKQLFYGELKHSGRKVSGQRKRYKDTLKVQLKDYSIDIDTWESLASDRPAWRSLINKGALDSQAKRLEAAKEERKGQSWEPSKYSTYPLVSDMWEGIPCPYWPHKPLTGPQITIFL